MTTGALPGGRITEGAVEKREAPPAIALPEREDTRRALLVALLLVVVLAALLAVAASAALSSQALHPAWADARDLFSSSGRLRAYLGGFGVLAPAAFFLVQGTQVVVSVIPAAPVTAAGVAAFGPWTGFALALGGALFGSLVAFLLGRRFGTPVVVRLVGRRTLDRYAKKLGGRGGLWIVPVLLLPLPVGGDAVCALAGLTRIRTGRFLALNLVGRTPGTVLNVLLASGLATGSAALLAVGGAVAAVLAGTAFFYARRCRE